MGLNIIYIRLTSVIVKVEPLQNETIQEQLDGMGRNVSALMRLVAPDCKEWSS